MQHQPEFRSALLQLGHYHWQWCITLRGQKHSNKKIPTSVLPSIRLASCLNVSTRFRLGSLRHNRGCLAFNHSLEFEWRFNYYKTHPGFRGRRGIGEVPRNTCKLTGGLDPAISSTAVIGQWFRVLICDYISLSSICLSHNVALSNPLTLICTIISSDPSACSSSLSRFAFCLISVYCWCIVDSQSLLDSPITLGIGYLVPRSTPRRQLRESHSFSRIGHWNRLPAWGSSPSFSPHRPLRPFKKSFCEGSTSLTDMLMRPMILSLDENHPYIYDLGRDSVTAALASNKLQPSQGPAPRSRPVPHQDIGPFSLH